MENRQIKYVARSTAIAARMLDGEMMIMSPVDSTFFSLNEVASAIWQAADGQTLLADIVDSRICSAFGIDRETALRDAEEFVEQLAKHGILRICTTPVANTPPSGVFHR
ncbi:MAG TPA: PqqD family protein [Terriglobales bacterium]|nr:PqqD family protein [Terriglobales bacterium]